MLACLLPTCTSYQLPTWPTTTQHIRAGVPAAVFKAPQATDTYLEDQLRRAEMAGLSPKDYEEATRSAANAYLASPGPHVLMVDDNTPPQRASFLKQLWGVDSIPGVPAAAAGDPSRVLASRRLKGRLR